jgi:hypothetical protein
MEYIEATRADIELANHLANEALGKSLDDLPPQTRRLLVLVDEMVRAECERMKIEHGDFFFSRRDVRRHTGWSDAQLKRHLHKLEELEYLIAHRSTRGQSFLYELYFEPPADPSRPFLPGLCNYADSRNPLATGRNGPGTPQARARYGDGMSVPEPINTAMQSAFRRIPEKLTDTAVRAAGRP